MAAGAWQVYGAAMEAIAENDIISLDGADTPKFRMALVTDAYTPVVDTHSTWTSVSASEVANGGGYTTHGKLLTMTVSRTTGTITVDCDDQSWTSSTITAKYAVIVQDVDANGLLASTDFLLCYADLETGGGSVSTTNGTFAVNINASGLFTIARA